MKEHRPGAEPTGPGRGKGPPDPAAQWYQISCNERDHMMPLHNESVDIVTLSAGTPVCRVAQDALRHRGGPQ